LPFRFTVSVAFEAMLLENWDDVSVEIDLRECRGGRDNQKYEN
jgi:hypothetical protein